MRKAARRSEKACFIADKNTLARGKNFYAPNETPAAISTGNAARL
jgi:hypothetical protein